MNILLGGGSTIASMAGRSMTPEQNEHVVEAIRRLLESGDWNQSTLAPRLGVKQTSISSLLSGRHRASFPFALRLAELLHVDVFELLDGRSTKKPPPPAGPRWRDLPWWAEVIAAARRLVPKVSELAWLRMGNLMGEMPPSQDPATLAMIAVGWDQGASDDERARVDAELADQEMAEEDAAVDDLFRERHRQRSEGVPLAKLPDEGGELSKPKLTPARRGKKRHDS